MLAWEDTSVDQRGSKALMLSEQDPLFTTLRVLRFLSQWNYPEGLKWQPLWELPKVPAGRWKIRPFFMKGKCDSDSSYSNSFYKNDLLCVTKQADVQQGNIFVQCFYNINILIP